MAIPNPNPNIADGMQCDNLTWSSNKIAGEIVSAAETIEAEIPTTEEIQTLIDDSLDEDISISLYEGIVEGNLPLPVINKQGKVVTINIYGVIKAGTYSAFYTVNKKPITRVLVYGYYGTTGFGYIDTNGDIKPNQTVVLNTDSTIAVTFVYITED